MFEKQFCNSFSWRRICGGEPLVSLGIIFGDLGVLGDLGEAGRLKVSVSPDTIAMFPALHAGMR